MFTKKLFGVAGAALLMVSGAANAINLSGRTPGQQERVVYATETLIGPGITLSSAQARDSKNGASGTYYRVGESQAAENGGGALDALLDVKANLGITAGASGRLLIRYDLTNAVFAGTEGNGTADLGDDDLIVPDVNDLGRREGGTPGSDYVIYSFTAPNNGLPAGTEVTLKLSALAIRAGQPVTIRMSVFDGSRTVINTEGTPESSASVSGIISSVPGISVRTEPKTVIADVGEDFAKFVATSNNERATLGKVFFEITPRVRTPNGKIATLADDLQPVETLTTATTDQVMATFRGDFSVGRWSVVSGNSTSCGIMPLTPNTARNEITVSLKTLIDNYHATDAMMNGTRLCVDVGRNNEMALPEGSYTVSFDLPGPRGTVASPPEFTGTIGSIIYNGTTIRAPYLTTHDGYNQRIVLVNRSNQNVPYSTTFTTEGDVTAVDGPDARGTLPANSTTVLRVAHMVTLTGGTRASGVINVTAQSGHIDAAVTQVNLEDGSADTVALTKTYN